MSRKRSKIRKDRVSHESDCIFERKKSIDEDGNPISVWNPDEPETDSDGKGRVSQVELFYSNGDICDITAEPREVIVRLKVIPSSIQPSYSLIFITHDPFSFSDFPTDLSLTLLISVQTWCNQFGIIFTRAKNLFIYSRT